MFARLLRYRPSAAMLVALIALLVALGGTGIARPVSKTSTNLGRSVKKALTTSKRANKNATKALEVARQASGNASNALTKGGPPGPKGDKGEEGTKGDAGPRDSVVVARPQGMSGQVATNLPTTYPLTGNTWTQQSNEVEEVFGELTYTPPASCPTSGSFGLVLDDVLVDGQSIATGSAILTGTDPQTNSLGGKLFEPGSDENRTLTVLVWDNCTGPDHVTIDSVKLTVVGFNWSLGAAVVPDRRRFEPPPSPSWTDQRTD